MLGSLDWGPVLAGYLAAVLLSLAYLSIGLFVSARTESQIVSLLVASSLCGFFLSDWRQFFRRPLSSSDARTASLAWKWIEV